VKRQKKAPLLLANRFPEFDGFKKNGKMQAGAVSDEGYLLLSSFDHKKGQSTVKLIRIHDDQIVHEWIPDIRLLAKSRSETPFFDADNMTPFRYQLAHPLLLDDGSLVFKSVGPLFKINACSQFEWINNGFFHHSIETDVNGNLWVPSHVESSFYGKAELVDHKDDAIAEVSARNGKVLYKKSVPKILVENGYRGLLFGAGPYENDAIHLNDIQPALYSTNYWKKGDLLVSIRNRSTVFLYRPSTNKIIWLKTGPWLNQHDADFVGKSKISIFGNDVIRREGAKTIELKNRIYVFDLTDGAIATPYTEPFKMLDIRTPTGGRQEILDHGDVFVEETDYGRLLRLSAKDAVWTYVVKVDDDTLGMLNWSRYLTQEQVTNVLPVLERSHCH